MNISLSRGAFLSLVNVAAFQVVWFASVLGAASGHPWLGAVALAPFAAWQLRVSGDRAYDLRALALFGAAGAVVDSLYPVAGMLSYAAPWPHPGLAPVWLVVMWLNLALTINHSLRWLRRRYGLAALLGGAGGALSYVAGWRLGAVDFHWPPVACAAVIGLAWALVLPVAYAILESRPLIRNGSAPIPR